MLLDVMPSANSGAGNLSLRTAMKICYLSSVAFIDVGYSYFFQLPHLQTAESSADEDDVQYLTKTRLSSTGLLQFS